MRSGQGRGRARVHALRPSHTVEAKLTADVILSPATRAMAETTEKVVVIGASTGGTEEQYLTERSRGHNLGIYDMNRRPATHI